MSYREFQITDEIKQLGFSRVFANGKTLFIYNSSSLPVHCPYLKNDLNTTMKNARKALINSDDVDIDERSIGKFVVLLSRIWVEAIEEEIKMGGTNHKGIGGHAQSNVSQKINEEIRKLKSQNLKINYEYWQQELKIRLDKTKEIAERNFPHSWTAIEFTLSILRILNISECTLPFAGIILSRAGGNKTLSSSMIIPWPHTYYIRNFTARAFVSHLIWFELCPNLIHDEETGLMKIHWNSGKDDVSSKDYIIKLGKLLGRLRGHVDIWSPRHGTAHNDEYSEYDYGYTQTEDPARAVTQLYNLARGHALLSGRNHILADDTNIVIKVVLSTASVERVAILDLLLAKKGKATLSQIAKSMTMSKSTALKAMTELTALKVVNIHENTRKFP